MIEPLRYAGDTTHPLQIDKILFCEGCLMVRARKTKPNVAIKICDECVRQYLCQECDELQHRSHDTRHHQRRTLVIGPGIRKRIIRRGDAVTFPFSLDEVKVKLKSRVYHKGKIIHREPTTYAKFRVGLSGLSVHVQVLGARNLLISDLNDTSDPFVTAVYSGSKIGSTRVRPRDLNPQWDNETFVVPMDDNFSDPKNMQRSQRHLFKLEVYDYDWLSINDFLGHVEIPRKKLYKMAMASNEKPICLPLTTREFHGIVGINLGVDDKDLYVKITRAESLDKVHPFGLNNPYAKVYFGDRLLGSTPVIWNTLDPAWLHSNVFRVKINDVLERERDILLFMKNTAAQLMQKPLLAGFAADELAGNSLLDESSSTVDDGNGRRRHHRKPYVRIVEKEQSLSVESNNLSDSNSQGVPLGLAPEPKETLPKPNAKEISELINMNMLDDEHVFLRIELHDFSSYLSHVHLGTARVNIHFLRKLLPSFPKTPIAEKVNLLSQLSMRFTPASSKMGRPSLSNRGNSWRQNSARIQVAQSSAAPELPPATSSKFRFSLFSGKLDRVSETSRSFSARNGQADDNSSRLRIAARQQDLALGMYRGEIPLNNSQTVSFRGQQVPVISNRSADPGVTSIHAKSSGSFRADPGGSDQVIVSSNAGETSQKLSLSLKLPSQSESDILGSSRIESPPAAISARPTFARQISAAIFGRGTSNKQVFSARGEGIEEDDELDHEELLEAIYGPELAPVNVEDEDHVLDNVHRRVHDTPDEIEINQNYEPTERKRIGGKVLKVAAYKDMMAKKAAKTRPTRSTHSSNSQGGLSPPKPGGSAGLGTTSQEGMGSGSPIGKSSLGFGDSQVSMKIGERAFDNEQDELVPVDGKSKTISASRVQFQDAGSKDQLAVGGPSDWHTEYDGNGQPTTDEAHMHEQEAPFSTDQDLSLENYDAGENDPDDAEYYQEREVGGELIDSIDNGMDPEQINDDNIDRNEDRQSPTDYDDEDAELEPLPIKRSAFDRIPGGRDNCKIVDEDVFGDDGLVPLGFEVDSVNKVEIVEDDEDISSDSGGSVSADEEDPDRLENVRKHRDGEVISLDHASAYVEEPEDENQPLLKNDGLKRRMRNTILEMFSRGMGRPQKVMSAKDFESAGDGTALPGPGGQNDAEPVDENEGFIARSAKRMTLSVRRAIGLAPPPSTESEEELAERARIKALSETQVVWSPLRHFHIELAAPRNTAQPQEKNRGFLVVRLIPSSRGEVIMGLDEAVRHMSLGEAASIKVRYDYAYGNYCLGGSIPPRANLVFTMELQEINGQGRFGMMVRQVIRLYRFLRRNYRRLKRKYNAWSAYMKANKPIKKCINPCTIRICGWDLFAVMEEETPLDQEEVEMVPVENEILEEDDEEDDDYDDDSASDEESVVQKVKVDKHMRRHVDKGVVSGINYLWGFNPNAKKQAKARAKALKKEKQLQQVVFQRQRQNAMLTRIREERPGEEEKEDGDMGMPTTSDTIDKSQSQSTKSSKIHRRGDDSSEGSEDSRSKDNDSNNGSDGGGSKSRKRSVKRGLSKKASSSRFSSSADGGDDSQLRSNEVSGDGDAHSRRRNSSMKKGNSSRRGSTFSAATSNSGMN